MTTIAPLASSPHAKAPRPTAEARRTTLRARVATITSYVFGTYSSFSIAKFQDYEQYRRSASPWRVLAVLTFFPAPALITSVIPSLISLQDPHLGILRNPGFIQHVTTTSFLSFLGASTQTRSVTGIRSDIFTNQDVPSIAMIGTAFYVSTFALALGYLWRFPVPFTWVLGFSHWCIGFALGFCLVFRRRLRNQVLRNRLKAYIPSMLFQVSQIIIYPLCSAAFEVMNEWQRVVFVFFFPLLKRMVRTASRRVTRQFSSDFEHAVDEVGSTEVCVAIYQAMIMQNTPSTLSTVLIISVDVIQGMFSIYYFMDKRSVVPQREIVTKAAEILIQAGWPGSDTSKESNVFRVSSVTKLTASTTSIVPILASSTASLSTLLEEEKQIVRHAREILHAAESILLVEYIEVAIPTLIGFFMVIAAQSESALYNPALCAFYRDPSLLKPAMQSLGLYTILQGLSIIAMNSVMRWRYGLSAPTLLAYVLERHALSILGKTIAWLAVLLNFSIVHYGADFKFEFKFATLNL